MNKRRTNCSPHGYSKSNGEEEVNEIIKRYNDANGDMAETEKELYGSYGRNGKRIIWFQCRR